MRPNRPRFALGALAAAALGLAAQAGALPIKDQEFITPLQTTAGRGTASASVSTWAQTFTVGLTGQLTRIDLGLKHQGSGTPTGQTFELRKTTGGVPSNAAGDVLAAGAIPASAVGTTDPLPSAMPSLDITAQNVLVTSGDLLAIVMIPATGNTQGWIGMSGNLYTAGSNRFLASGSTTWTTVGDFDYSFRTWVDTAVPEPGMPLLALTGLAGLGWIGRRRLH